MRNAMIVGLALGCGACVWSMARTLERHYRQGYVGSAVMFGRLPLHRQEGLETIEKEAARGL